MTSIQEFLDKNRLPASFETYANKWFDPLLDQIEQQRKAIKQQPLFVGISGCQGSGKSTLADYLTFKLKSEKQLKVVNCSLDDFYLTKTERAVLANNVHPLLKTRGVPGTHDIDLAINCFHALQSENSGQLQLPIFDKLADDRASSSNTVQTPVDVLIFEGWCLGAEAQSEASLKSPINALEEEHDRNGSWRAYANSRLSSDYNKLFNMINYWIMLKAPSFDCVLNWRTEQEEKLAARELKQADSNRKSMSRDEIKFFISHYQRITEQLLESLPSKANIVFELDDRRSIHKVIENP